MIALLLATLLAVTSAPAPVETAERLDELGMKPRLWLTFDGGWTSQGAEEPKWDVRARGAYASAAARGGKEAAHALGASCPGLFETKLDEEYTIVTTVKGGAISNGLVWAGPGRRGGFGLADGIQVDDFRVYD